MKKIPIEKCIAYNERPPPRSTCLSEFVSSLKLERVEKERWIIGRETWLGSRLLGQTVPNGIMLVADNYKEQKKSCYEKNNAQYTHARII